MGKKRIESKIALTLAGVMTMLSVDWNIGNVYAEATDNVDKELVYFVDCGDYDVTTLSKGDLFGICNRVTEQVYGEDPETGYEWGIVDYVSSPLKNGSVTNNAAMTNTVFTDDTWPCETDVSVGDGSTKEATNRYTKNQYENGIARNLNYEFEVPNAEYEIELYFTDPWGCSKNPIVAAEGETLLENVAVNSVVTAKVKVEDKSLNLNITAPEATLCINLAYIKIYRPDTLTPESFFATESADAGSDKADTSVTTGAAKADADSRNSYTIIYIVIAAVVVIAIVGCVVIVKISSSKGPRRRR